MKIEALDLKNFEKSLDGVNLFPKKVKNLEGREITLAIFNYMPYTLWKDQNDLEQDEIPNAKDSLLKNPLFVDGTETWVFLQFCKRLNCSLLISLGEIGF